MPDEKEITEANIRLHLQTLTATPQRITASTAGMDEKRLSTPAVPKEWSAVKILAHLRGCAEVWAYSIYAVLTTENLELGHIHPRDWVKKLGYVKVSFAENFRAFEVERTNLLRVLGKLSMAEWQRTVKFVVRANTTTVFHQTQRMAQHEAGHCDQIEAIFRGEG